MSLQYYHVINAKVENNNDKMMEVTMIKISNFFFFLFLLLRDTAKFESHCDVGKCDKYQIL